MKAKDVEKNYEGAKVIKNKVNESIRGVCDAGKYHELD